MHIKITKHFFIFCSLLTPISLLAKDNSAIKQFQNAQKKPLLFLENKGQITDQYKKVRNDIQYSIKDKDMSVFIGHGRIQYQFNKMQNPEALALHKSRLSKKTEQVRMNSYRMDVALVGANINAPLTVEEPETYTEYYRSGKENTAVHTYKKITYKNVYKNIDWVLYIKDNKLEYDFIVHPNGNVNDIKIKYGGYKSLVLNEEGGVNAVTPFGKISEMKPFAYEANTNRQVKTNFKINKDIIGFNADPHNGTLVIDPSLIWSTYYGGSSDEAANGAACDGLGNVYIAGNTISSSNIATTGAYQTTYGLNQDAFLAKFSDSGKLLWATYFGGSGIEQGSGVACDFSGNPYLTGWTSSSTSIATSGSYQSSNAGSNDAFLAKFTPSGTLSWATYYGGSDIDEAYSVACDVSGKVIITGETFSTSGIASTGSHQDSLSSTGIADAFVAKFNSSGTLDWATYCGGDLTDIPYTVTCDPVGNIFIGGITNSLVNLTTTGSFQDSIAGGFGYDGFIAKFDSTGALSWATDYGGTGYDYVLALTCDATGNLYATGNTGSSNGIAYPVSFDSTLGGGVDGFLAKFSSAGKMMWSTYYGGTGDEDGTALVCDAYGYVYMAGVTASSTGIATSNGYQSSIGGSSDAYLVKFDAYGQRIYGTYLGGTGEDQADALAINPNDNSVYIAGSTTSSSAIASTGAYQTSIGGSQDAFLARFYSDTDVIINQPYTDTLLCLTGTFKINYTVNHPFQSGNTFTVQLSDNTGSFASPTNIGSVTTTTSGSISCTIPGTASSGPGYRIRIVSTAPAFTSPDDNYNIDILFNLPTPVVTSNSPVCTDGTLKLTASSTEPVTYVWTGPGGFKDSSANVTIDHFNSSEAGTYLISTFLAGCSSLWSTTVTANSVYPEFPVDSTNSPICGGSTLNLYVSDSLAGTTFSWVGPDSFSSVLSNPSISSATSLASGTYYVTANYKGCTITDSLLVNVNDLTTPSISITSAPGDTICAGQDISFIANSIYPGNSPAYQWYDNGFEMLGATSDIWGSPYLTSGDVIYCVLTSDATCITNPVDTSNKISITILPNIPPTVNVIATPGTDISLGETVTFTASASNLGTVTTYQWYQNGFPIAGATSVTYTTNALSEGDVITVKISTNPLCSATDTATSNELKIHINTGVATLSGNNNIALYPNPNKGNFIVKANADVLADEAVIEVLNVVGQVVYSDMASVQNGTITRQINLEDKAPNGIYLLRIKAGDQTNIIKFTIQK